MQLLYVANRYEKKPAIERAGSPPGAVVVCDRYLASSIAYGEAQGLDAAWLREIQRFLPPPDLTILLDIAPETAAGRKTAEPRQYERDLALLSRVRESYRRQAAAAGLAAARRRAREGRRRRRRPHGRRDAARRSDARPLTTRAAVSARTLRRAGRPAATARARLQRRAGRAHIVHQHDRRARRPTRAAAAARRRRGRCACRRAGRQIGLRRVCRVRRSASATGSPSAAPARAPG